jgi:hypothetical protein
LIKWLITCSRRHLIDPTTRYRTIDIVWKHFLHVSCCINMAPVTVTFAITVSGTNWSLRLRYVLKHACVFLPTSLTAKTTPRIFTKKKKTLEAWLAVFSIFKGIKRWKNLMALLTINVGVFTCTSFSHAQAFPRGIYKLSRVTSTKLLQT